MKDTPPKLAKKLETARIKQMPKGQIIFYQGDNPQEVHIVKTGIVKLHNFDTEGNEKILHLLHAQAVLPWAFFSGDNHATKWFYTAVTDCELYVMSRDELQSLIEDDSPTAIHLMNQFSNEVHELLVRLDSMGKTNVKDKLQSALTYLAVREGVKRPSGWIRIPFPVSHQMLADMVGATRESAAIAMKEFADDKKIRNPRQTILEVKLDRLLS